jgi:hypothetical protein
MVDNDPEERAHYESVLLSFREYEAYVMREIFRRKKHLQTLPADMQRRLPQSSTLRNLHHLVVGTPRDGGIAARLLTIFTICPWPRMQHTTTSFSWSVSSERSLSPVLQLICRSPTHGLLSRAHCAISPRSRVRCTSSSETGQKRYPIVYRVV